jgi:copper chaperone CopZ
MSIQKLKIEGMTCNGCVGGVTRALKAVPGVTDVRVSLAEGNAEVEAAAPIDPTLLTGAVEKKGYRASISQ